MNYIIILSVAGIVISMYGVFVEKKVLLNENYQAACDLSDTVSCTRTFLSPYSKLLGISNIWLAFAYYCCMFMLGVMHLFNAAFLLSCLGLVASVIFAYILYFKMRTVCLICTSLYIINIVCVFAAYSLLPL